MGKVAVSRWNVKASHCFALAAGCFIFGAVQAQQAPQDALTSAARSEAPLRIELNTSSVPRLDGQDSGFQAPRMDLSVLPNSGSGLGVAVGFSGFTPRSPMPSPSYGGTSPSMDLGLHFRHQLQQSQIDVTAWKRITPQPDALTLIQQRQPVYGARVEMKLTPVSKAGFKAERSGFLGMQLEGGAKISIKRKDGRPMVYYRNTF